MTQKSLVITKLPSTISSAKKNCRYLFFSYPFLPGYPVIRHCIRIHISTLKAVEWSAFLLMGGCPCEPRLLYALTIFTFSSTTCHEFLLFHRRGGCPFRCHSCISSTKRYDDRPTSLQTRRPALRYCLVLTLGQT